MSRLSIDYPEIDLTEQQAEEAERIADILRAKAEAEVRFVSRLLASKSDRELLGETEFQIRDAVHRLGAQGIDAALSERKKRGTKGRALSAGRAGRTRSSKATGLVE
jgi:hypothetical protein